MTGKTPKRKYRRWPGMTLAARELDVSYGHLLMCIKGTRKSVSLLARYRVLKAGRGSSTKESRS